jgi:PiT family inorganic phosphate transporter
MPVSTTHSIVGGMVGFGIAAKGISVIRWIELLKIAITWVASPIIGGILAFIIFKIITVSILHREKPLEAAKIVAPIFIGTAFFIIGTMLFLKTFHFSIFISLLCGTGAFMLAFLLSYIDIKKTISRKNSGYNGVEGVFRKAQVITSCYVSFSHGANDVANAIGPVVLIYTILKNGDISGLGYKVMKTVGTDITELNNTRGFAIDFATATTVLFSSLSGFPVSTTHTVVGAVTGIGLARGAEVVNFSVLKNIFISWVVTVPFAAFVSAGIYKIFA